MTATYQRPGESVMRLSDRVIADLMTALDAIRREAHEKASEGSLDYIFGLATQAMTNCDVHRVRNADGYLIVKPEKVTR